MGIGSWELDWCYRGFAISCRVRMNEVELVG
jgi:hypothetical protein